MMRAVARVAGIHGNCITIERATDAARLRRGDRFFFACDEAGDRARLGWHEIERVDAETGVWICTASPHGITPAACYGDWLIAPTEEGWSPYRHGESLFP